MTGNAPPRSSSYALALAAWKKALKDDNCNPALTWSETGADSIASLHLLLELERAGKDRSLGFDSIRPHTRIEDIAALLDAGAAIPHTLLPTIHLFPGLYGDDPRLANFRHAVQPAIRFHVHELPDLRRPAKALRCLQLTGELAAANVATHQPEGPLFLTGFSFGGGVAFEAARALTRAGRQVAFLCLLDTILGTALAAGGPQRALNSKRLKRASQLALISSDASRTALLHLLDRMSPIVAHRFRRYMYGLFREYAMRRWAPTPLDVNTLLAASEEYGPRTEPLWRHLCPRVEVVRLPNGHIQLFEYPALGLLAPTFEQAVRRAAAVAFERPQR